MYLEEETKQNHQENLKLKKEKLEIKSCKKANNKNFNQIHVQSFISNYKENDNRKFNRSKSEIL